jgi:hypothetical protein
MGRPPAFACGSGFATALPVHRLPQKRGWKSRLGQQKIGRPHLNSSCDASAGSFDRPSGSNNSTGDDDFSSYTTGYQSFIFSFYSFTVCCLFGKGTSVGVWVAGPHSQLVSQTISALLRAGNRSRYERSVHLFLHGTGDKHNSAVLWSTAGLCGLGAGRNRRASTFTAQQDLLFDGGSAPVTNSATHKGEQNGTPIPVKCTKLGVEQAVVCISKMQLQTIISFHSLLDTHPLSFDVEADCDLPKHETPVVNVTS